MPPLMDFVIVSDKFGEIVCHLHIMSDWLFSINVYLLFCDAFLVLCRYLTTLFPLPSSLLRCVSNQGLGTNSTLEEAAKSEP